jgi:hypothetical protein
MRMTKRAAGRKREGRVSFRKITLFYIIDIEKERRGDVVWLTQLICFAEQEE